MNKFNLSILIMLTAIFLFGPAVVFTAESGLYASANPCDQAKEKILVVEHERSILGSDTKFMRTELDRLKDFHQDLKTTRLVLDDARKIMVTKAGLSPAQRITFNSRIPVSLASFNTDGTFTLAAAESAPIRIDEAADKLNGLLTRTEDDIKMTESEINEKEQKNYLLGQRLKEMQAKITADCGSYNPGGYVQRDIPRVSSDYIYQRLVEKEQMRQTEVNNRYYLDIERLYVRSYYHHRRGFSRHSGYHSKGLLIGLRGEGKHHYAFHCLPFLSEDGRKEIIDAFTISADRHEHYPGVGKLDDFKVVEVLPGIDICHDRLR